MDRPSPRGPEGRYVVRLFCPGLFASVGGAEKYAATLAQFLADRYRGLDLGFVVYGEPPGGPAAGIGLLNDRYGLSLPGDIGVTALAEAAPGIRGRARAVAELTATSRGADLYLNCFHNVHYFYARKNVHVVLFPADRRTKASPTFSKSPFLKPFGAVLDAEYRRRYALFICISEFTKSWLGRYWGVEDGRCSIVYPPVAARRDPGAFSPAGKEKLILLVGRFDERKNILELVRYFAEHEALFPGWRLVAAGAMKEGERAYYESIAAAARGHRVELRPNVGKAELDALYGKAAVFWHGMGLAVDEEARPVDVEHFGISTVEAMSAGAVPVVIDKGGQREIVDEGVNGRRWRSLEELGRLTGGLVRDEALRRSLARAAVEKSNAYSLEAFYASLSRDFRRFRLIPDDFLR